MRMRSPRLLPLSLEDKMEKDRILPQKIRNEARVYEPRLRAWVKKHSGLAVSRSFNNVLAGESTSLSLTQLTDPIGETTAAAKAISAVRPVIYANSYLASNRLSKETPGTARIERGQNRRARNV
jgi:hypothetical protein